MHADVNSGICFESQNTTYFAYSAADQQHYNICVHDFIRQIDYCVFTYSCLIMNLHQKCPQLFTLLDQYLVIRDSDRDHILDTKTNFSLIFNISSGTADILAVLHISNTSAITPSPPIASTTTESAPSSMNFVVTPTPKYTHTPTVPSSVTIHTSSIATTASPGIIILCIANNINMPSLAS